MAISTRTLQALAATTLTLILGYCLLVQTRTPKPFDISRLQKILTAEHFNVTPDLEVLQQLKLPASFEYQRRCISARENDGLERESLVTLIPPMLNQEAFHAISLKEDVPVRLESTLLPPCDSSDLVLGVATTTKRMEASLPAFSRWLSRSGSILVVLLIDRSDLRDGTGDLERIQSQADSLDIELIFEAYSPVARSTSKGVENFSLATILDKYLLADTKWFGVIDDDTFFVSLPRVLQHLQPYDPVLSWYIGGLSESHTVVAKEGFKAWGGAGFFISPPLMRTIAAHAVECARMDRKFGDLLWRDCIQEITSPTVPLTEMPGLHQLDMGQDPSGWYEAGFDPILSIHHWKSWHHYPAALGHLVTDVAGPDTFLQRYKSGNQTIFTNGYSIATYSQGLPDLNLLELTMTEAPHLVRPPPQLEFHHRMGHTRPALKLGKDKIQWRFEWGPRQFYVKRSDGGRDVSIIEVDWRHV
ncbi:hypothetical protein Slin14017_G001090 [Septoria linicola]|nr:hypothetical protein Slin14017_G001090 [Septoria linicola]